MDHEAHYSAQPHYQSYPAHTLKLSASCFAKNSLAVWYIVFVLNLVVIRAEVSACRRVCVQSGLECAVGPAVDLPWGDNEEASIL